MKIRLDNTLSLAVFSLLVLVHSALSTRAENAARAATPKAAASKAATPKVATPKAATPNASPKLAFALNDKGLSALSYAGRALVDAPEHGVQLVNGTPKLQKADGTTYSGEAKPLSSILDAKRRLLTQTYSWGLVTCLYTQDALKPSGSERLTMRVDVLNTSNETLSALEVQLGELDFGLIPDGMTLDPGMFGTGAMHPLHQFPLAPDASVMPPLVAIDTKEGALDFCLDDLGALVHAKHKLVKGAPFASINVPWSANQPKNTRYPFRVAFQDIAPGESRTATVSWRLGAAKSRISIVSDLIARFRAAHPFALKWPDRRPIATMFLATSEAHPAKNPRGWFNNSPDVDTTTPEGVAALRVRALKMADDSVAIMKQMNAQGMVLWDGEGQEFGQSAFYGDPRLQPRTAPEMSWKPTPRDMSTLDAYFKKFRDAGLRVGVCIRPQQITFENDVPIQRGVDDAFPVLKAKIEYARKRWGCTLFYVDSTVDGRTSSSTDADVFERLARLFPDVLLMPENQNLRYYAHTAPLDSFMHHHVAATPPGARAVYPQAFSVLLGPGEDRDIDTYHDALVEGVRRGDILMFHGWWNNPGNAKIKAIYDEAAKK